MLKHQVRTLNRERRPRKSLYQVFDPDSSGHDQSSPSGSSPSPTLEAGGTIRPRPLRRNVRSTSVSSLSGSSTTSEQGLEWGTLRVYTSSLRADSDYKTLFINTATTADDLIQMILAKFTKYRSKLKDLRLFYLTMEIVTKHEGRNVPSVITLDSHTKPLELQNYHPRDRSRFSIQVRQGQQIRIYDNEIFPESRYKSLLISDLTTSAEVISLVLQSHRLFVSDVPGLQLCIVNLITNEAHPLFSRDILFLVLREPWVPDLYEIRLMVVAKRSLEQLTLDSVQGYTAKLVPASTANASTLPSSHLSKTESTSSSATNTDFICQHFDRLLRV